jgi:hypothetical protein
VLVDGDGVARAVADLEGLGVTVGAGLAFGVALRALDADGDGCDDSVGVGDTCVPPWAGDRVSAGGYRTMYNARIATKKTVITAVDVRTGRRSRSQVRIGCQLCLVESATSRLGCKVIPSRRNTSVIRARRSRPTSNCLPGRVRATTRRLK